MISVDTYLPFKLEQGTESGHNVCLGPLHTRAKSRDHEIVRAQRKCPKAVPIHLQNHVVWSRALKCSVKAYVIGSSTKCYFNEFLFTQAFTHDKKYRIKQRL